MDYLQPLFGPDLRAHGVPEPWRFGIADRVRFSEIDALNHVNHTAYLRWFESFRIAYLAEYDLSLYRPKDMQVVLKEVRIAYRAPLFLGDSYLVTGRTVAFRSSSFTMAYAVWVGGQERVSCETVIVSLEQDGQTKRPLTDAMRATLASRDGARDDR